MTRLELFFGHLFASIDFFLAAPFWNQIEKRCAQKRIHACTRNIIDWTNSALIGGRSNMLPRNPLFICFSDVALRYQEVNFFDLPYSYPITIFSLDGSLMTGTTISREASRQSLSSLQIMNVLNFMISFTSLAFPYRTRKVLATYRQHFLCHSNKQDHP